MNRSTTKFSAGATFIFPITPGWLSTRHRRPASTITGTKNMDWPSGPGRTTSRLRTTSRGWPASGPLEVRMGNDTKPEVRLLTSPKRCEPRTPDDQPLLMPRDDDFFLHYELLDVPSDVGRPLPQAGPHQTSGDGCKPAAG